ncbi:MAG: nucleoside deaminase [Ignavibacteria bacterium]|nr:nucleoside deaminase [Ignavibacteria bacterium]
MNIELPDWCSTVKLNVKLDSDNDAMQFALDLVEKNIENKTGGPFAAVIVDSQTRLPISFGVNIVEHTNCSVFHAEIVSIIRASYATKTFDLGRTRPVTLYTTAEPCAMCMGAIPWAGIGCVVTGATDSDVREVGFDEGAKPADWLESYYARGIVVRTQVLRRKAIALLQRYVSEGGNRYNGNP